MKIQEIINKYNPETIIVDSETYYNVGGLEEMWCWKTKQKEISCKYIKLPKTNDEWVLRDLYSFSYLELTVYNYVNGNMYVEMYRNENDVSLNSYPHHNIGLYTWVRKFTKEVYEELFPEYYV